MRWARREAMHRREAERLFLLSRRHCDCNVVYCRFERCTIVDAYVLKFVGEPFSRGHLLEGLRKRLTTREAIVRRIGKAADSSHTRRNKVSANVRAASRTGGHHRRAALGAKLGHWVQFGIGS